MRLLIHILFLSRTLVVEVPNTLLVIELKRMIKKQQSLPMSYQRLFTASCEMMDELSLQDYKLVDKSRIDVFGCLNEELLFVEFPNEDDYRFHYDGSLESLCEQIDRMVMELPLNYSLFCGPHLLTQLNYKELFGNQSSSLLRNQDQGFITFTPKKSTWFERFYCKVEIPDDTAPMSSQRRSSRRKSLRKLLA